jgi:hypothetical protein
MSSAGKHIRLMYGCEQMCILLLPVFLALIVLQSHQLIPHTNGVFNSCSFQMPFRIFTCTQTSPHETTTHTACRVLWVARFWNTSGKKFELAEHITYSVPFILHSYLLQLMSSVAIKLFTSHAYFLYSGNQWGTENRREHIWKMCTALQECKIIFWCACGLHV